MHDPSTLAFSVKIPLPWKVKTFWKDGRKEWAKYSLLDIWHVDPCKGPGGDDSCGWFMRAHHGDQAVMEKIEKRFAEDWDRVFNSQDEDSEGRPIGPIRRTYFCGYFCPNGDPHFSVHGIVLNLFFTAAMVVFESDGLSNWRRAKKFMRKHLFDILMFAENPHDSLFDGITRKFEIGCGEKHDARAREQRIRRMAACIYGWILREERPWYRHPRWHIHHWQLQLHPWQNLWHWITRRCAICGKRFRYREVPISDWAGTKV